MGWLVWIKERRVSGMNEDIRIAKGHTMMFKNADKLKDITSEVVEIMDCKELSVGEIEAILKDAIVTINSISRKKKFKI